MSSKENWRLIYAKGETSNKDNFNSNAGYDEMTEKEVMETIGERLCLFGGVAKDKFRGESAGDRDYLP